MIRADSVHVLRGRFLDKTRFSFYPRRCLTNDFVFFFSARVYTQRTHTPVVSACSRFLRGPTHRREKYLPPTVFFTFRA